MENLQKKKKQQFVRVVLTEILMAVSVLCLTAFLTLLVLGYNIGDKGIERSGLVQINSIPTGATISIDGEEELLFRTNLSKAYSKGKHKITLTKNGYDTWEKEINVMEGYYYRLNYPRLFLSEVTTEKVIDFEQYNVVARSTKGNALLVVEKNTPSKMDIVELKGSKATVTGVDIADLYGSDAQVAVEFVEWSANDEKALVKTSINGVIEWVLVDLRSIKDSVNLTKTFGVDFIKMKFENGSASKILAIVDGDLREVSLSEEGISKVLVANVSDFTNNGENVVYVAENKEGKKIVGVYKEGEKAGTEIYEVDDQAQTVRLATGTYYEDDFVGIAVDNHIMIYQGVLPSYDDEQRKELKDFNLIIEKELVFDVTELKMHGKGELMVARNGENLAVMDAEEFDIGEYKIADGEAKWLDDFMMYSTRGNKITVWDFDGLNQRTLNIGEVLEGSPVMITENGKWMYYLDMRGVLRVAKVG